MNIIRGLSRGQLAGPLLFGQDAVAASQTDVQLPAVMAEASTAGVDGYEAPFPGEIVAVAFSLSAAGSAGIFTIGATINGTEDPDTTVTVGNSQASYKRIQRGKARFRAGDAIGAEITTNGSWDAVTADLLVQIYVVYDLTGI